MKTQFQSLPNDRAFRRIVAVAGVLVFGLGILLSLLLADVDDSDSSSHRCPGYAVGTVDPATCLPYGSSGAANAGTSHSGSGSRTARKPAQPKAPAPKAPAAPPRISVGKR